jgi:hypothetical protein
MKLDLAKDIIAFEWDRIAALSAEDKSNRNYQQFDQLELPEGLTQKIESERGK